MRLIESSESKQTAVSIINTHASELKKVIANYVANTETRADPSLLPGWIFKAICLLAEKYDEGQPISAGDLSKEATGRGRQFRTLKTAIEKIEYKLRQLGFAFAEERKSGVTYYYLLPAEEAPEEQEQSGPTLFPLEFGKLYYYIPKDVDCEFDYEAHRMSRAPVLCILIPPSHQQYLDVAKRAGLNEKYLLATSEEPTGCEEIFYKNPAITSAHNSKVLAAIIMDNYVEPITVRLHDLEDPLAGHSRLRRNELLKNHLRNLGSDYLAKFFEFSIDQKLLQQYILLQIIEAVRPSILLDAYLKINDPTIADILQEIEFKVKAAA